MKTCLLLLAGLLATAAALPPTASTLTPQPPPPRDHCRHGRSFIDECNNACICQPNGWYKCKPNYDGGICYILLTTGHRRAQVAKPDICIGKYDLMVKFESRSIICKDGIIRFEDVCTPNIEWQPNACQRCVCTKDGEPACTLCLRQPTTDQLAPGEEEVPIDQECRLPLVEGPRRLTTKVCKAPTRQECNPGTEYNLDCDICICLENGVPACTKRDCRLPEYGDTQVCDSDYRECPADCGRASEDSYCVHCQCGPRLKPGDIVAGMGNRCPPGYEVTAHQWATQTCSPAPPSLGCQYGPYHLDECTNVCRCVGDGYACGRKGCPPGLISSQPLNCNSSSILLPKVEGYRVYCEHEQGIVKIQPRDERCVLGTLFMDDQDCMLCECLSDGDEVCGQRPVTCPSDYLTPAYDA